MDKKRVAIITGVSSFLGISTARKLLASGFIVFGIIRNNTHNIDVLNKIKGLVLINLDFSDINIGDFSKITQNDFSDVDITLIHFAWGSTLDRNNFMAQMYNIDTGKKVIEFAKKINVNRFIFAGSQAEMSDSAYGIAKKEFANVIENSFKGSRVDCIHMRIFSIYGKDDRETSLIKMLVKSIKENTDIDLSECNYMWNFLFIDDFTNIIYKLIDKNVKTGVYDIASDDTRLLKNYVIETHKVLKGKNKLNFGKRAISKENFAIPDITNIIKAIGEFDFTKFKEGIKKV